MVSLYIYNMRPYFDFHPKKTGRSSYPQSNNSKEKKLYKLFLKEEKDTKRFFEDYRNLFFS